MEEKLSALRAKIAWMKLMVDAGRERPSKLADLVCELDGMEMNLTPAISSGEGAKSPTPAISSGDVVKNLTPTVTTDRPLLLRGALSPPAMYSTEKSIVKMPAFISVKPDVLLAKKAELTKEIDALRKMEGRRANELAMVADDVPTPEQCEQLVKGRLEIERLYDDYYFMERTGQLPNTPAFEKEVDPEIELKKFQLDAAIKSAKNILYKAECKMKDMAKYSKKNRDAVVEDTQAKIDRYEAEVERLEVERRLL